MKVTMYELLGMVKDGTAPKKILINDKVYYLLVDEEHYVYSQSKDIRQWVFFIDHKINIQQNLDLEVLILDENYEVETIEESQEHKIPEKICTNRIINTKDILEFEMIQNKINAEYTYAINEIIDYINKENKCKKK